MSRALFLRCLLAAFLAAAPAMPVHAVPHPSAALEADPDYRAARERIKAKDFHAALPLLHGLLGDFAEQAEVHSLIGFALRKTGRLDEAFSHYRTALRLDPDHLGANEYLGELYVQTGRLDLAGRHLDRLRALCGEDCEETRDLAAAIAEARGR